MPHRGCACQAGCCIVLPVLRALTFSGLILLEQGRLGAFVDQLQEDVFEGAKGSDEVYGHLEGAANTLQEAAKAELQDAAKEKAVEKATQELEASRAGERRLTSGLVHFVDAKMAVVSTELIRRTSSLKEAAEKRGYTNERFLSWQVKLRILVSLVQVISQLGVVFAVPYPPFYDSMVDWLGVFSLNFVEMMPLACMFHFDHDHSMMFYTGTPLVLAALTALTWRQLKASVERKRKRATTESAQGEAHVQKLLKRASDHEALADQLWTWLFILFYLLFPSKCVSCM